MPPTTTTALARIAALAALIAVAASGVAAQAAPSGPVTKDGRDIRALMPADIVDAATIRWADTTARLARIAGDGPRARAVFAEALRRPTVARPDSLALLKATAISFLMDGDRASAVRELGGLLERLRDDRMAAAQLHAQLALVDGAFGDGTGVGGHLAEAFALGGRDAFGVLRLAAQAWAYANRPDSALAYADLVMARAARRAGGVTTGDSTFALGVRGVVELAAGRCETASRELRRVEPPSGVVLAVRAECASRLGDAAAADLRERVLRPAEVQWGPNAGIPLARAVWRLRQGAR